MSEAFNRQEQFKLIDKYERLFAEDGWKELVEDLREKKILLRDNLVSNASTSEKDLYRAQGSTLVYDYIIGLPDLVDRIKNEFDPDGLPSAL